MPGFCTPTYLTRERLILSTWCPGCLTFGKDFTGDELAEKFGPDAEIGELEKRMVCQKCGHRGVETRINSIAAMKVGMTKTY